MAAAAGKKGSVSLSLFIKVHDVEAEEELSTMATLAGTEGVWLGKWRKRAAEGSEETDFRSADVEAGERTCRSRPVRNSGSWHHVTALAHPAD